MKTWQQVLTELGRRGNFLAREFFEFEWRLNRRSYLEGSGEALTSAAS